MAAFNLGSLFLSPTPNTPEPTETHRIIQLVQEGNLRKLKKLITEKNINELHPCSISIDYITPLMAAAKSGREDICTFLLKQGANPNMLSINKQSVLNYASYSSVNIVKQLIAANADPNVIGLMTPVQFAATIQRDDIVKELILSGASPEMCVNFNRETHEKVLESLKNLASKSQDFVTIKKLYDFTVTLWGNAKPEEVLTQYREDLQEEHPVHHHTMVEVCFSLDNVDLHRLCIEALQKTKKLDVYANEISSRLSRVTMCYKQLAIKSLNAVCCVLREIPLELSINVVPTLLELLIDPRISCEMHYTILTLLYVIVQKTSGRQYGWEKLFIENLCKGVISFTATEYPPDVGIVAYAIIADLYEYQCVSDMITEMRITSVPEKIIQTADMGMNEEMKERIRNLNSALSKKCYSKETGDNLSDGVKNLTLSKKKKKKKKKKRPGLKEQSKGEEGIISEAVMESSVIEKTQSRFDGKMGTPVEEVGDPQPTTTTISGDSIKDDVTNPFIDLSKKFPRRWHSISVRWKSQLQMLANMDSSHMTKVGSLNFKVSDQYRIAKGNDGTEVYLGLRDDGTEVAIKRILKSNYEALKHELSIIRLAHLDSPHIVHYVDFAEDEHFGYLVLQLCEYSLEEYITDHLPQDNSKEAVKELLRHIFSGLSVLHKKGTKILHRDIKPQNVLIDITGKARLADFGISRKLHVDQTTLHTKSMGTRCWMPWEAIDQDRDHGYKRCSDIQVAGMLMYYTLSGGHHPFGNYISCEVNILKGDYNLDRVQDDLAKDLIEWMITCEPEKRPSIEEVLIHPYFWTDKKKVEYLVKVGNEEEVVKRDNADVKIVEALEQLTAGRSFSQWKSKLDPELVKKLDRKKKSYPENTLGLLRFIRNLHEHWKPEAAALDLFAVFPDLFSCVYKFAKANGWNERIALRTYFED